MIVWSKLVGKITQEKPFNVQWHLLISTIHNWKIEIAFIIYNFLKKLTVKYLVICQNGCSPSWRKWCSGICFEVAPVWLWIQLVNYLLMKLQQQEVLFGGICARLKLSKTPENKRILVSIRYYTWLSSRKLLGDQAIHILSTEGPSAPLFGLLSVALCLSHPPLVSSFVVNKSRSQNPKQK